jgi:hypothetical protein
MRSRGRSQAPARPRRQETNPNKGGKTDSELRARLIALQQRDRSLLQQGKICDSGRRRNGQIVWVTPEYRNH